MHMCGKNTKKYEVTETVLEEHSEKLINKSGTEDSSLSPQRKTAYKQEPITRSVQLAYFLATALSQVGLFLDEAFFCGYILHITVNYAIASD